MGVYIVQEKEKRPRLNGSIVAREVRVIGVDGEQVGILSLAIALRMAEESRVDLVEVVPNATPPVCRLVDYGKYKYQEAKKLHEFKMKQKVSQVKEVKLRPCTDEFDYQVKVRSLIRFLDEGHIAKVTLRFRGREMTHQDLGMKVLERVREDLTTYSQVQQMPKLEGRQIVMVLAPLKRKS